MTGFFKDARCFRKKKQEEVEMARQAAAFFLACGIDLSAALALCGEKKTKIRKQLVRLIERERLRGQRRHWSYDLNRHIALKQALDQMGPPQANI